MRGLLFIILSFGVTILAWGLYGPMLHSGQNLMSDVASPARLRPFVCVGLAYFAIGVIVPAVLLITRGEKGAWTVRGMVMSLLAGALGAIGALGIVMAFTYGGKPAVVMPLVFGGAPVVNSFLTIYWSKRMKEIGPIFVAGLFMVLLGAVTILVCKPAPVKHVEASPTADATTESNSLNRTPTAALITKVQLDSSTEEESIESLSDEDSSDQSGDEPTEETAEEGTLEEESIEAEIVSSVVKEASMLGTGIGNFTMRIASILTVIVCWGVYGPILHAGQAAMQQSRMRPFLCVGIAYFAIAVIVPNLLLSGGIATEASSYTFSGTSWSLAAGAAGAIGALGIILAFNFGGKPIYVMPLVFGGAPVVNTFATVIANDQLGDLHPFFLAGLILVISGAAMVLIFAPKGPGPKAAKVESKPVKSEPKPANNG